MRDLVFLALLLPVWVVGLQRSERITGAISGMAPFFAEDLARFDRVRPSVATSARAYLFLDPELRRAYGQRLFSAQYSLAPTVLSLAFDVREVVGGQWSGQPRFVLCDFDDAGRRRAALSALEAESRRRNLLSEVVLEDGALTLVRLSERVSP